VVPACDHGVALSHQFTLPIDFPCTMTGFDPSRQTQEVAMPFTVYEITAPLMVQGLMVLDDYLDHAQALERQKGMDPGKVLEARLAPDMLTFGEQFSVSCNKVDAHMAKLLQRDRPAPRTAAMIYPALRGRLVETRGFLQGLRPDELASAQAHTYELAPPIVRGWFRGDDYIRHLVIPDFFFHTATARHPAASRRAHRETGLPRQPQRAERRLFLAACRS
jgi:hypothetical protein